MGYNPYDKENYRLNTPEYKEWRKQYMKDYCLRNKEDIYEKYLKKYSKSYFCEVCKKEVSVMNTYHQKSQKHLKKLNQTSL
jgi:thiaminase